MDPTMSDYYRKDIEKPSNNMLTDYRNTRIY